MGLSLRVTDSLRNPLSDRGAFPDTLRSGNGLGQRKLTGFSESLLFLVFNSCKILSTMAQPSNQTITWLLTGQIALYISAFTYCHGLRGIRGAYNKIPCV